MNAVVLYTVWRMCCPTACVLYEKYDERRADTFLAVCNDL